MQPVQCDPIHEEQAKEVTTASHWSHRTHRTQVPATTPPSQEVGRAFAAGRSVVQPPSHLSKLQNGVRLLWRQRVTPQEATTQAERIVGSGRHQRPIPAQYHSIRRTQAQAQSMSQPYRGRRRIHALLPQHRAQHLNTKVPGRVNRACAAIVCGTTSFWWRYCHAISGSSKRAEQPSFAHAAAVVSCVALAQQPCCSIYFRHATHRDQPMPHGDVTTP